MKNSRGMTFIEIVASMIILMLLAVGVYSTLSFVTSQKSGAGIGLDTLATNYARGQLEVLRNAVSSNYTLAEPLNDTSHGTSCTATAKTPCNTAGRLFNTTSDLPSDFRTKHNATMGYTVWDISSGNPADGFNGVAYKKVTAKVTWDD